MRAAINKQHSKMKNSSVKKLLKKSKNILEQKQTRSEKFFIKKSAHTRVYNNCFKLHSKAIENICNSLIEYFSTHNRLNVGRIALERLVAALNELQPASVRGGGGGWEPKCD